MLQAEKIQDGQHTLIRLSNEKLDATISGDLKALFVAFFQDGGRNLIFDMQGIRYCDSSGLSAILIAHRMAGEKNGSFVLCRVSDHVAKLLKISQLDTVLSIVPTPEEATDLILFNEIENQLRAESGED
jgi:anti-sigma B factor antagonist